MHVEVVRFFHQENKFEEISLPPSLAHVTSLNIVFNVTYYCGFVVPPCYIFVLLM